MIKQPFVLFLIIASIFSAAAQQQKTVDFYQQIKDYDLSIILTADSILTEDREENGEKLKRAEILGYLGTDFQRFQIHFTSIIKNQENPYQYFAYGKTMVKGLICTFQGTVTIKDAGLFEAIEIPNTKQGFASCEVVLYEDQKQSSTGMIKGKLESHFLIDQKGRFRYDAVMFVADGFSNNKFIGTWTSYKTNVSKKCNWGDYRIPQSKGFDVGAGEFSVDQKYIKNGWENYNLAWNGNLNRPESKKARQKEEVKWWE